MALRDYEEWLTRYDDPSSALSWRLAQVQRWLGQAFDRRPGELTVLSVCSGDGRDVIDVLARRDDPDRIRAILLEAHAGVAERARTRAAAAGLSHVVVRTCDAADTDQYVGAVPADVVVLVGVLGNLSHEDLFTTIAAVPQWCAPAATLIWSRGSDRDDLDAEVRLAFVQAGFTELDHRASGHRSRPVVGLMRYDEPPVELITGRHLFTFWR